MLSPTRTRTQRSRSDWKQILSDYEQSDSTVQFFCESRGIASSNFYYWKKRLTPSAGHELESQPPRLLSLPIVSTGCSDSIWRVELDLGEGVMLRVK